MALEEESGAPGFWAAPEQAQKKMSRLQALREPLAALQRAEAGLAELDALVELAGLAPGDAELAAEHKRLLPATRGLVSDLEAQVLLDGPYDRTDALLAIHPGAGGTESQDWAAMLLRMYRRWAEARGYRLSVLDLIDGEEAGIKSVTLAVRGTCAYGTLHAEKGVHRLVRMSPFDSSGRRHTSFASVDVLPDLPPEAEVEIRPEDLDVDTFRSSGAGGQHINRTDSAIRITHRPSGIVVTCQNERSQHGNRETAMTILRARLAERRAEEREREVAALRGEQGQIAFGSQVRSYVFAPYTLVKDHRTGVEAGNVQAVMDGGLDPFISAFLVQKRRAQVASTP